MNCNYFWSIWNDRQARKKWLMYGGGATVLLILIIVIIVVSTISYEPEFRGRMVLNEVPLIDGHNDLPNNLYAIERNVLSKFNLNSDLQKNEKWNKVKASHTDLPRLIEGKVGGQFWVAYVDCKTNNKDAVARTMDQIDVTKRLIAQYPDQLGFVTTADGISEAFHANKIASLLCVEGGHSIDSRMSVLRLYYELGVRYLTLTHNCDTPWAKSHSSISDSKGLTEWGKNVVLEMNRLGMMVDLAHVSETVMIDAMDVTKAPVIFSHSSAYSVHNHSRNVKDDVLIKLKNNNGIIMVNFYPGFIAASNASLDTVIAHLNHIKKMIGPDHIGIGADYDGVDKTPIGLEDVSKYPDLFDKLAESGHGYEPWSRQELQKLAGLNLIRVFKEVEKVKENLQSIHTSVFEEPISLKDLGEDEKKCRSDVTEQ